MAVPKRKTSPSRRGMRRSADALTALGGSDVQGVAVPALDVDDPVFVRASGLSLLPAEPAKPGQVRARSASRPRNRKVMVAGLAAAGIAAAVLIAGGAVIGSNNQSYCSTGSEFCGFGAAITGVTLLGFGGATGAIGIVLAAVGGSSASPEVAAGRSDIVYLPR